MMFLQLAFTDGNFDDTLILGTLDQVPMPTNILQYLLQAPCVIYKWVFQYGQPMKMIPLC